MIETLKSLSIDQIQTIVIMVVAGLASIISIAEVVTRLTPTKDDDGAVTRVGERIDKLLDLLRVPNKVKPPDPLDKKIDG